MKNNGVGGLLALHAGCKFFPNFKSHFLIKSVAEGDGCLGSQNTPVSPKFIKSETLPVLTPPDHHQTHRHPTTLIFAFYGLVLTLDGHLIISAHKLAQRRLKTPNRGYSCFVLHSTNFS